MSTDHHHEHSSSASLKRAFILNLSFTIIELVGGLMTNSVAILSDAVHDLGDSLSLGFALWTDRVARVKRADDQSTYGYRRLTLLSSLINALVLVAGSTLILTEALPRLWNPDPPAALGMIGLSVLGILVNGIAVLTTRRGKTLNEKVVSWHLLEDALGWAVVLVGSIVLYFTGWAWIDPLLAVGISVFILFNIVRRIKEIVSLFLQQAPRSIDVNVLRTAIESHPAIDSTHHLHLWSLDGEHHILTVHAVLAADSDDRLYREAKCHIRDTTRKFELNHVTVELEYANENCDLRQTNH